LSWTDEERRAAALDSPIGSHALRPGARVIARPGWYQIITPGAAVLSANEVVRADPEDDAGIDAIIADYDALGLPFKWCVYPWSRPADLGERLTRRGLLSTDVRAMVRDTEAIDMPAGVTAERATAASLDAYIDVMVRGWEMGAADADFYAAEMRRTLAGQGNRAELVLARVDGAPAGCASVLLKQAARPYGYLVGAIVLLEQRGRGVYRALLAARLAALAEQGIELATTHAREATSAPMLAHLGFDTVFRYTVYRKERG
jgi:hypothetical protein